MPFPNSAFIIAHYPKNKSNQSLDFHFSYFKLFHLLEIRFDLFLKSVGTSEGGYYHANVTTCDIKHEICMTYLMDDP